MNRAGLEADLRQRVFAAPEGGADRIGVEAELIPLTADGEPVPIEAGAGGSATLPMLRRLASQRGWSEGMSAYGAPRFGVGGGWISFEPGGQLELSSAPLRSASALLEWLQHTVRLVSSAASEAGIELHSVGIDPLNALERVPLQLRGERYSRMAAYFDRRGPAGGRMMRQTAAFQLNLDLGREPFLRWRVLNAAAPYLIAIFANSPRYAGAASGHRSFRAHCWRVLDPLRTGLLGRGGDPVREYLEFALGAPPMLEPGGGSSVDRPLAEQLQRGPMPEAEWRAHLSTLFPEVRPKGYLELRAVDATPPTWYAAPLALLGGLLYDPPSLAAAWDRLGEPDPEALVTAGEQGMGNEAIAAVARDVFEIGLAGAVALGAGFMAGADLDVAREFYDRYTRRGRSPADDLGPELGPPAAQRDAA